MDARNPAQETRKDKEINSPIEPLSNYGSADTLISVQQILDFWHLEL